MATQDASCIANRCLSQQDTQMAYVTTSAMSLTATWFTMVTVPPDGSQIPTVPRTASKHATNAAVQEQTVAISHMLKIPAVQPIVRSTQLSAAVQTIISFPRTMLTRWPEDWNILFVAEFTLVRRGTLTAHEVSVE